MKPFIIPIFIPNQGCPHLCVFCDQKRITSQHGRPVHAADIQRRLEKAMSTKEFVPGQESEVAFYGGTFTNLPVDRMVELLDAVHAYIKNGMIDGIRVSTRPDALDERRLFIMYEKGVRTVELGAQSMDDGVLECSRRGHTATDTAAAVKALRRHGFRIGLQLQPGLPGDSPEIFGTTVGRVIALRPGMVRLYPTLVIEGTELAELYRKGLYKPLALEDAVDLCAESCARLEAEGIAVIRIGLMSSPDLLEKGFIIAGPWHTAFGFLVRSRMYHKNVARCLPKQGEFSKMRIWIHEKDVPLLRGYRNQGIMGLKEKMGVESVEVRIEPSMDRGGVRIEPA